MDQYVVKLDLNNAAVLTRLETHYERSVCFLQCVFCLLPNQVSRCRVAVDHYHESWFGNLT